MVTMVELEEQGPALRALGSLLKLTEVFVWDDGSKETKDRSLTKSLRDGGDEGSSVLDSECGTWPEDMELTRQMNELGLPVSFHTNKDKRNTKMEGKRKGMRLKHPATSQGDEVEPVESFKVSEGEVFSPVNFDGNAGSSLCCMMGQSESSSSDVAAGSIELQLPPIGGDNPASSTKITYDASKEHVCDGILDVCNDGQGCDSLHSGAVLSETMEIVASSTDLDNGIFPGSCSTDVAFSHDKTEPAERLTEHDHLKCSSLAFHEAELTNVCEDYVPEQLCVSKSVSHSMYSEVLDHDGTDSQGNGDFGDWMIYWDSYYMRNYFYNIRTQTSTWYPPPGMEHLATDDTTYKSNEVIVEEIEMGVAGDMKAADLCGLSKPDSFEDSLNDDVLHDFPYNEFSGGVELTIHNYASDTIFPTVTASRCPEHSHELESNSPCNDGNILDHISRNKTKQAVAGEICNCDLQRIPEEKADGKNTSNLYNAPYKINSLEGTPKDCKDDGDFQILDRSSLSNTTFTEDVSVDSNMHSGIGIPEINELELHCYSAVVKRKKKVRKMQIQRKLLNEELVFQGLFKELSADIGKYWNQRYLLFSRYDDGIKMDEEGWFSVTPEPLARHHAERCGNDIIIDCFTGVGGNSIQFAQISKHVTAIDIDPKKIDYAQHNAAIYGVDDRIDFVKGDFFRLAPSLRADIVFLSPPWGGPDYAKVKTYDLKTMLKPHDGFFLFNTAKEIASRIVMFLPRNVVLNQLAELALSGDQPWSLEVEKNFLNGKLKGITAYFSKVIPEGSGILSSF